VLTALQCSLTTCMVFVVLFTWCSLLDDTVCFMSFHIDDTVYCLITQFDARWHCLLVALTIYCNACNVLDGAVHLIALHLLYFLVYRPLFTNFSVIRYLSHMISQSTVRDIIMTIRLHIWVVTEKFCLTLGSNQRPLDQEFDALPTELNDSKTYWTCRGPRPGLQGRDKKCKRQLMWSDIGE
jgi:hypothetical protein